MVLVGFDHREVGADGGDDEFHDFAIVQYFGWGAVVVLECIDQAVVVELMQLLGGFAMARGVASGDKKMFWPGSPMMFAISRQFECDEAAHAVPEEDEGEVVFRLDHLCQLGDQRGQGVDIGFAESHAAAWQLDGADFNVRVHHALPWFETGGTAACIGEAKHA